MGGLRVDDEVQWNLLFCCFNTVKTRELFKLPTLIVCRFIYTGSIDITLDIAQDLLRAADQYLLEGLKRLCEYTIAQVGCENLSFYVFMS